MCFIWCVWVGMWNGTVEVEDLGRYWAIMSYCHHYIIFHDYMKLQVLGIGRTKLYDPLGESSYGPNNQKAHES
jgi:hypothetical protein